MIGIIGYGRFGRLMAGYLAEDFPVAVASRTASGKDPGNSRLTFASMETVCREKIVVFSVPISAFVHVLQRTAPLLRPDALVVDVCSVKLQPVAWMQQILPESVSILATHPMFGPDSAADSLRDRKIVLCPVRISPPHLRAVRSYLAAKGLQIIETSPDAHDRQIAVSLALTHFIGRALSAFGAGDLAIDTEGYRRLRHILGVVEHDTWQLFEDMHTYNPHAAPIRKDFIRAMQTIDRSLTGNPKGR